jgi:hypothetical protein
MLTARDRDTYKIETLDAGADDYVTWSISGNWACDPRAVDLEARRVSGAGRQAASDTEGVRRPAVPHRVPEPDAHAP